MKELDFDELDKAVNSLMSNVPKDTPPGEAENTVTIPPSDKSQPVGPPPPVSTPVANSQPSPSRSVPSTGSLAARRGGRFMDMVHPSADMKKPEPTKPVSRQGATIAPSSTTTPPPETPTEVTPVISSTPTPSDEPMSSPHQPQAQSDWPDPLDMASSKDVASPADEVPKEEVPEVKTNTPDPDPDPLTSPFLPNTKVEKRPLGSPVASEETPELSATGLGQEDLTVDNPDAQLPPAPSEPEQPLPEELQGDLVAIESGSAKVVAPTEAPKLEEKPTAPEPEEEPKLEEKPPAPSGPVSIPKQYKEEPSTSEQESGAIYDTDSYHQPLAHPAKKKSGWLWVLWIVLILVVGAATGAALYFYGII